MAGYGRSKMRYIKTFSSVIALSGVLSLAGCSSSTPTSDVGIYLSDDVQDFYGYCPTLEVDIAGLTKAEEKRLSSYDVDKYFSPPEQFRKSLGAVTVKFSDKDMIGKVLPSGDGIWDKWNDKGVTHLAIIVNLPIVNSVKDVQADPRKLIIDLNEKFISPGSHYILIGGSGVIEVRNEPADAKTVKISGVEKAKKKENTEK
jgi:hypothetical protein